MKEKVAGLDASRPQPRMKGTPMAMIPQRSLFSSKDELTDIFHRLLESLAREIPDLGAHLAADSKAIRSLKFRCPAAAFGNGQDAGEGIARPDVASRENERPQRA